MEVIKVSIGWSEYYFTSINKAAKYLMSCRSSIRTAIATASSFNIRLSNDISKKLKDCVKNEYKYFSKEITIEKLTPYNTSQTTLDSIPISKVNKGTFYPVCIVFEYEDTNDKKFKLFSEKTNAAKYLGVSRQAFNYWLNHKKKMNIKNDKLNGTIVDIFELTPENNIGMYSNISVAQVN